jgi:hypothetical protein
MTMPLKRKIRYSVSLIVLLSLAVLCGFILYLYHHPQRIKSLAEGAVSSSTGTVCRIERLTYSLAPLRVQAEGLSLRPKEPASAFDLHIPSLQADLALQGSIGRRTLLIKMLKLEGPILSFSEEIAMAMLMPAPPEPSILEEIFQGLFGLLVFRDIEFEAGSITDGSVEAGLQDLRIHAQEIEVLLSKDSPLRAIGHLSISWPSMHIERLVSDLSIRTENAPSFEKTTNRYHIKTEDTSLMVTGAELQGEDMEAELSYDSNAKKITVDPLDLRVGGIQLEGLLGESSRGGPPVGIQGADLKAKLSFSMNQRECVFDSVQLRLKAVSLGDRKGEKAPPSDLRLSYKGTLDLDDSRLSLSQLDVEMGELIDVKGALEGAYSPGPEISRARDQLHIRLFSILEVDVIGQKHAGYLGGIACTHGDSGGVGRGGT